MHIRIATLLVLLLAALWLAPSSARAEALHLNYAPGWAGQQESMASRVGDTIGGIAGAYGGYLLGRDKSTLAKIGIGLLGSSVGSFVGRRIGDKFGKKPAGQLFRSLLTGAPTDKGVTLGVSYHQAPMATVGWKF